MHARDMGGFGGGHVRWIRACVRNCVCMVLTYLVYAYLSYLFVWFRAFDFNLLCLLPPVRARM